MYHLAMHGLSWLKRRHPRIWLRHRRVLTPLYRLLLHLAVLQQHRASLRFAMRELPHTTARVAQINIEYRRRWAALRGR